MNSIVSNSIVSYDKNKLRSGIVNFEFTNSFRKFLDLLYSQTPYGSSALRKTESIQKAVDSIYDGTANSYYFDNNLDKLKGISINYNKIPLLIRLNGYYNFSASSSNIEAKILKNASNVLPNDIYPIAVRMVTKDGNYYIERPPFKLTLDFRPNFKHNIELWVPWTITVINKNNINKVKIFFSGKSLQSTEDNYFPSVFPNTYQDGSICFSNSLSDAGFCDLIDNQKFDIRHIYSFIFNEYMNGGWNSDLSPNTDAGDLRHLPVSDNFPLLKRYSSYDQEKLSSAHPKLRQSSINKIIDQARYGYDRSYKFKYLFLFLGSLNLEETLQFYTELIEFYKDRNFVKNVNQFVDDSENSSNLYENLNFKIHTSNKDIYEYEHQSFDNYFVLGYNFPDSYRRRFETRSIYEYNELVKDFFTLDCSNEIKNEIFQKLINNDQNESGSKIILVDILNQSIKILPFIDSDSLTNFYYDTLIETASINTLEIEDADQYI